MTSAQEHPITPGERATSGTRPPLPPVPEPTRRHWSRRLLTAVVLVLLFAVGIWLGRSIAPSKPAVARAAPAPLTTIVTVPGRAPASCVSALERSDAAIRLLVKGVRDQRLTDQLNAYLKAARACRKATPSR